MTVKIQFEENWKTTSVAISAAGMASLAMERA